MESSESIDDDFGDFGGFEVAEPVVAEVTPAAASTDVPASPWTVMAAATLNPDGLVGAQAQGAAETSQSAFSGLPSGATDGVAMAPDPSERLQELNIPGGATDWAALGEDPDRSRSGTSGSGNIPLFEANFDCLAEASGSQDASVHPSSAEGKPPDQGAQSHIIPEKDHSRTPLPFQTGAATTSTNELPKTFSKLENFSIDDLELELTVSGDAPKPAVVSTESAVSGQASSDQAIEHVEAAVNKELEETKADNQQLTEEKANLQKELDDLAMENKLRTSRLEVLEHKLQEQREKQEQVQAKHSTELEEMRHSGQRSLAIIVEEYKEMCKAAVLQQQTESLKMLQALLAEEMEKHEDSMKKQEESYAAKLDELSKELEEKNKESLAVQREEAKEAHQRELEGAVEEERSRGRELLDECKVKWQEELETMKKENEELVVKTVQKEQVVCKEYVKNLISERMKQHEENVDALKTETQQKIKEYVQENKEAEHSGRRHVLHSSELFLEAAKQQIQLLLQPNTVDAKGDIS